MKKIVLAAAAASIMFTGAAAAADLAARPYTKAPPPVVAPVFSWTGFYIGGNIGGAWTDFNGSNSVPCSAACVYFLQPNADSINALAKFRNSSNGTFTGGVQAGYNWQSGAFVGGVEGDINWIGAKSDFTFLLPYVTAPPNPNGTRFDNSARADWMATIRGRLGVAAGSNVLLYVTGGAAIANIKLASSVSEQIPITPIPTTNCAAFHCGASSVEVTKVGWVAGAGAEWAFGQNWSVKGEYLYARFAGVGSTTSYNGLNTPVGVQLINHNVETVIQTARVGINYRFGGPVVARY